MIRLSWTEIKTQSVTRKQGLQFVERSSHYRVFILDGSFEAECFIKKTNPANADQLDFETNYKNNLTTNKQLIQRVALTEAPSSLIPAVEGFNFTAIANTTTSFDFQLTKAYILKGAAFLSPNASFGDFLKAELVDKDNLLGQGANTILATPINKLFLQSTINSGPIKRENSAVSELPIPGLYLRITYTNAALLDNVRIFVNLDLYERV